jgi:hypothetical protein
MKMIKSPTSNTPRQLIKAVYGIRGGSTYIELALADANNGIMNMDAPDWLPSGSTYRKEERFDDGTVWYSARETLTTRTGHCGNNYRYGEVTG